MKLIIFFLFIVIACAVNYKYVDLALKKCPYGDGKWSVHGFWPEYNEHSYPQWCDKSRYNRFNQTVIEPIRVILDEEWGICPSWKGTSDIQFWRHEWEKHGTCTNDTVIQFFTHTIEAFLMANANDWYGCCNTTNELIVSNINNIEIQYSQCLIPFSKNETKIKWLGWCKR